MSIKSLVGAGAALLLTLSGCATEAPATGALGSAEGKSAQAVGSEKVRVYDKSKQADENVRCRSFRPTGSHRNITRCTTAEQRELEEDAGRRTVQGRQGPNVSVDRP
ncbi:MAG: hypothetical protein AB8G17_09960 [Gammaproteobacteria bacterium]